MNVTGVSVFSDKSITVLWLYFVTFAWREDIPNNVIKGLRPTIPDHCPKRYAKLISECWASDPNDRYGYVLPPCLLATNQQTHESYLIFVWKGQWCPLLHRCWKKCSKRSWKGIEITGNHIKNKNSSVTKSSVSSCPERTKEMKRIRVSPRTRRDIVLVQLILVLSSHLLFTLTGKRFVPVHINFHFLCSTIITSGVWLPLGKAGERALMKTEEEQEIRWRMTKARSEKTGLEFIHPSTSSLYILLTVWHRRNQTSRGRTAGGGGRKGKDDRGRTGVGATKKTRDKSPLRNNYGSDGEKKKPSKGYTSD